MGKVKQFNIKNYFYNDMTNLKNVDSNLLKIDKKYYKGKGLIFTALDTSQLKKVGILKIFTV